MEYEAKNEKMIELGLMDIYEEAKVSMIQYDMKCLSPLYRENVHCVVDHQLTVTLLLHNSGSTGWPEETVL